MVGKAVEFSGGWAPGEKVVARREVDRLSARGPAVKRVRAGKDGSLKITGLEPGIYHLQGADSHVTRRVTVAAPDTAAPAQQAKLAPLSADDIRERLARTRPAESRGEIVTGTRSTASRRRGFGGASGDVHAIVTPQGEVESVASSTVSTHTLTDGTEDVPAPARRASSRRASKPNRGKAAAEAPVATAELTDPTPPGATPVRPATEPRPAVERAEKRPAPTRTRLRRTSRRASRKTRSRAKASAGAK